MRWNNYRAESQKITNGKENKKKRGRTEKSLERADNDVVGLDLNLKIASKKKLGSGDRITASDLGAPRQ